MQLSQNKPAIFFSHCWQDDDYFKNIIYKCLVKRCDVDFDKNTFLFGDDLDEDERKIKSADCVVVFLSKSYIKASKDPNRGVFRENQYLNDIKKKNLSEAEYVRLPIFYFLLEKISNVEEFIGSRQIYCDLTEIKMFKNQNRYTIHVADRNSLLEKCKIIIQRAGIFCQLRDPKFKSIVDMELKLWHLNKSSGQLPKACMVVTKAYEKIFNQFSSTIIGRKGSGKSTFFEVLKGAPTMKFLEKFKTCEPVQAEYLSIEAFYKSYCKYKKDIETLGKNVFFDEFWKTYFSIQAYYTICIEYINGQIFDAKQRHNAGKMLAKLRELFNVDTIDISKKEPLPNLVMTKFVEFLKDKVIDYANLNAFETSILANFSYTTILKFIFGEEIYKIFLKTLHNCKKRIFIYFDAFDTLSDDFRYTTNKLRLSDPIEANKRVYFETYYYRQLILTVEQIKETSTSEILNSLDFCIIFSKDRIDQIRIIDRDFTKRRIVDLQWSAKELLKLLIFRIKYICNKIYENDKKKLDELKVIGESTKSLLAKCSDILHFYCPNMCLMIDVLTTNGIKKINIIKYILSISLWRPRDLIKYMVQILVASRSTEAPIHSSTIQELLDDITFEIIDNEFINEYKLTIVNIEEILEKMNNLNAINSLKFILEFLADLKITNIKGEEARTSLDKLQIFYELGIIGIIVPQPNGSLRYSFIFNEGQRVFDKYIATAGSSSTTKLVFNPLFYKYCNIIYNSFDIICDFDDNYLDINDMRLN